MAFAASKSVRLSSLSKKLHDIDPSSPTELRTLYDELLALTDGPHTTPVIVLPATKLSLEDVIDYFQLANAKVQHLGFLKVMIPEFRCTLDPVIRGELAGSELQSRSWLDEGISKSNAVWGHRNEVGRRVIVDLLVTDVLWRARKASGASITPQTDAPPLRAFAEISFSHSVMAPEAIGLVITGRCDICFGYGDDRYTSPQEHTFLGVLEVKKPLEFEKGFPQLLAYLGTLHHARRARNKANSTVYGVATDGQRYCFAKIDNNSMAYRSRTYDLVENGADIYDFFFLIIRTAARSSPTTSPTKPRKTMEREVSEFSARVEQVAFLSDLVVVENDSGAIDINGY